MDITRRNFVQTTAAGFVALATSDGSRPPIPQAAPKEQPITQFPDHYEAIFKLSNEQKIMLAAGVAFGDAVALYKPGNAGFALDKHIDLYKKKPGEETKFAPILADGKPGRPGEILKRQDEHGTTWRIPVLTADNKVKAVVVLHESATDYDKAEPEYCRQAKRRMAQDIVKEYSDLVGASGLMERQLESAHDRWNKRHDFYMKMVKDMFSTFTRAGDPGKGELMGIDPQAIADVSLAKDSHALKAGLRKWQKASSSDQYSHILGVSDLMEHTVKEAVNAPGADPKMSPEQTERMVLLALLHDVKTQQPSQYLRFGAKEFTPEEREFSTARNGRHPFDNAALLALNMQDALHSGAHHHGFKRYGPEEIASIKSKKTVSENFNDFTMLSENGDVAPNDLPPLVKLLRVCDVTEAITGRVDKPLHEAVRQLGTIGEAFKPDDLYNKIRKDKEGKPVINPDTIDPDCLCFMIVHGVFDAYGKQRTKEAEGWISKKDNRSKYDKEALGKIQQEVLARFGWVGEGRAAKEAEFRKKLSADVLLMENSAQMAPSRAAAMGA